MKEKFIIASNITQHSTLRTALTTILILGALGYLGYTLTSDPTSVHMALSAFHWPWLGMAIIAAMPMFLLKGFYHLAFLDRGRESWRTWVVGIPIYLQAQIVRYLPGKIWGLAYQAQRMSGTYAVKEVMLANLWQTLITNLLAIGFIASLLLGLLISPWYFFLIPLFLGVVEWLHRQPKFESLFLKILGKLLKTSSLHHSIAPLPPRPWILSTTLCLEWLFYFLAIWLVLYGHGESTEWFVIGALYSAASVIALFAFVVPAGLVVREAIFVSTASLAGTDASFMAVFAIVMRIVFLAAEIGIGFLASISIKIWRF